MLTRHLATVAALTLAATLLPATNPPAQATTCPDPAGTQDPFDTLVRDPQQPDADDDVHQLQLSPQQLHGDTDDNVDVVFNGGGFGHGIGMSQYGAQGAATSGCDTHQILTTYFPNTDIRTTTSGQQPIRVGIYPRAPHHGSANVFGLRNRGTQPLTYNIDGNKLATQPVEHQGKAVPWYVCHNPNRTDGVFTIHTTADCRTGSQVAEPAGNHDSQLTIRLQPNSHMVSSTYTRHTYARGTFTFTAGDVGMSATIQFNQLDDYLYGLAEMPSSWHPQALQAQAILGRSYAATAHRDDTGSRHGSNGDCNCDIYSTTYDQHYTGYAKENPDVMGRWAAAWPNAVDATHRQTLTHQNTTVRGYYSSSHGGHSADPQLVWGTKPDTHPYLQPTNTTNWEDAATSGNPRHRWSIGFTNQQLADQFGLDTFTSIRITEREPGGRPVRDPDGSRHGIEVTGTRNGNKVVRRYAPEPASGRPGVRGLLGLPSGLFHITTFDNNETGGTDTGNQLPAPQFDDVDDGHLFKHNIDQLARTRVTRGCNPPDNTRFCPDAPVTRGQMAAFLDRALGLPDDSRTFDDTDGHLFENNVAALADAGITRGCNPPDNTRFCPDAPVTRGQMAAFLHRALDLAPSNKTFTDTDGHLFENNVAALADAGITRGCNPPDNTRFCPDAPVTRGQMAAFLHRADILH